MGSVFNNIIANWDDLKVGIDSEIDSWMLMESPLPVLTIVAVYLYFVLSFGPNFMRNREPYQLKKLLIVYNAFQCLFSFYIFSQGFRAGTVKNLTFTCQEANKGIQPVHSEILRAGSWWYFFSKIIELFDTVFFVLRKKQNQVTFLHVYHHSTMALFSWGYLKYMPGQQGALVGFLNCFVHIIMYFYYMVAAMGPKYQKYIWWKKYMTGLQLAQFILMLSYLLLITFFNCKLHRTLTFFFFTNVAIFLYLFLDFYRKVYVQKIKVPSMCGIRSFDIDSVEAVKPLNLHSITNFEKSMKID